MGIKVSVGVKVTVGVAEGVAVLPVLAPVVGLKTKKTTKVPITKTRNNKPIATGSERVISGIRLGWMDFWTVLVAPVALSSVPQTTQRIAFSLRRVPQVGQTFVLREEVS